MRPLRLLLTALALLCLTMTAEGAPRIYSEEVAKSFVTTHPDPDVIRWGTQANHFTWQAGYMMFAMEKLWRMTNDTTYLNYVRRYVDQNVDAEGRVPGFTPRALDNFIPGYACLLLYELTGEQRYARAAETIRRGFDSYPRNKHGVFYHSHSIQQLWVDGVFMGQIFLARYARTMGHPEDFAEVVKQLQGLVSLCGRDDGLFYHGWAEQGKAGWAKQQDSHSAEVWSEGLGWGAVLLADVFDYLPADQPGREPLLEALRRLCQGLKDCQDPQTGLWCQVVDKPMERGNWNVTSGSAMFTYLLQSAINKGYISGSDYQPVVDRAYQGLLGKAVRNSDGGYHLKDCSSIGIKGSYQAYISQPREISTFAAVASFIIGTGIVEHDFRFHFPGTVYATDYTQGRLLRLDGGQVVWQHDAPLSNDLCLLPDGHLLFTTGTGVLELDARGDTVFRYQSDCHVFACQRLPNGNTFVGECEKGRLLEVSPKGRIVSAVSILPKGAPADDMAFMRNARRLSNGHYLVAHYRGEKVVEYDRRGRAVWTVSTPGRAHSVIRLENGNTLVSIADANKNPRIEEYDPDGRRVWQLTNDDLPGRPLRFMSGMQYLEGRGLLLTNWQGHGSQSTQPHMMLVDRNKHIVCTLPTTPGIRTISNVAVVPQTPSGRHDGAQALPVFSPVNPHATPEARALLAGLYQSVAEGKIISGLHHNQLQLPAYWRDFDRIEEASGKVPMIWGGDLAWDARQVVEIATREYHRGHIVTLMWHVNRPFDRTPHVDFKRQTQGEFTAEQWNELVSADDTPMKRMWMEQVDSIAQYLKVLKDRNIPVLWRPYHEMNGEWFWWGDRRGERGFTVLWKMLYDRMVNHHHLDNLIWVWNANAPRNIPGDTAMEYSAYYPGNDYVDVLATDVYHRDWRQSHHDELVALGKGKLVALGELGSLPTPQQLAAMNRFAWFMIWTGFTDDRYNTLDDLRAIFSLPRVVCHQERNSLK